MSTTETKIPEVPGIALFRTAFPAHWALEQVHPLIYPNGIVHLRLPDRWHRLLAGGPDSAMCDEERAPDHSTYDGTVRGAAAVKRVTCMHCQRRGEELLREAEEERPELLRLLARLEVTERAVRGMLAAGGVADVRVTA